MSIERFRQKRRKDWFGKWIYRAMLAEAFFLALSPEAATIALIIGAILTFLKFRMVHDSEFRHLPFDVPVAVFVFVSALSIVVSPDPGFSFYNYYNLVGVYLLTYLFIGQNVTGMREVKGILMALTLSAALVILYGFSQFIFGIDTTAMRWVDGDAFPELKNRVFSTWENPNILAGYLDAVICVALGFFAKSANKPQRIVLSVFMALAAACLALTYARGACLTLAIILLGYGMVKDWRIFLGCLAVGCGLLLVDATLAERLLSVFTKVDTSSEMRLAFWESTLAMIQDHPFLGIGWGAFWLVYPEYDFYLQGADILIVHAHNMYLNYAAEIGLVGALAFCWYFFGTMLMALRAKIFTEPEPIKISRREQAVTYIAAKWEAFMEKVAQEKEPPITIELEEYKAPEATAPATLSPQTKKPAAEATKAPTPATPTEEQIAEPTTPTDDKSAAIGTGENKESDEAAKESASDAKEQAEQTEEEQAEPVATEKEENTKEPAAPEEPMETEATAGEQADAKSATTTDEATNEAVPETEHLTLAERILQQKEDETLLPSELAKRKQEATADSASETKDEPEETTEPDIEPKDEPEEATEPDVEPKDEPEEAAEPDIEPKDEPEEAAESDTEPKDEPEGTTEPDKDTGDEPEETTESDAEPKAEPEETAEPDEDTEDVPEGTAEPDTEAKEEPKEAAELGEETKDEPEEAAESGEETKDGSEETAELGEETEAEPEKTAEPDTEAKDEPEEVAEPGEKPENQPKEAAEPAAKSAPNNIVVFPALKLAPPLPRKTASVTAPEKEPTPSLNPPPPAMPSATTPPKKNAPIIEMAAWKKEIGKLKVELKAEEEPEAAPPPVTEENPPPPPPPPVPFREALRQFSDDRLRAGFVLGIGLAFISVALNGITDDLLFNIPSSMLLWLLAALSAIMADEELWDGEDGDGE